MELKIIYFNFPFWRAEVARIPLYISNTKFEDKRITSEEFSYIKENGKMTDGTIIPFSQLPVLVIDGQSIAQTGAIARICGKISGFYPDSLVEAGKVDQIIDTATDINMLMRPSMREQDPDKKKLMRQELSKNDLPKYFGFLENLLKDENIWFAENRMTIADIAIWRLMGWLKSGVIDDIPQDITDDFNKLNRVYNEVNNNTDIKRWVSETYK
jgi:glutathione S-transferase